MLKVPLQFEEDFIPPDDEENDLYQRLKSVSGFTGDPDQDASNPEIQALIKEFSQRSGSGAV